VTEADVRPWDVLLIGGASGVGKSTVGARLAHELGIAITGVDDLHTAVRMMTTPEQLPELHYWHTNPAAASMTPTEMVNLHISVSRLLLPAVRAVVAQHVDDASPAIVEGDYLVPEVLDPHPAWKPEVLERVRGVFLHEADVGQVVRNLRRREPAEGDQTGRATVTQVFGRWLRQECRLRSAHSIDVRPLDTAPERILAAL